MFKKGEYIVHGRNGVCQVEDITHIDVSGADKNQLYYTLVPMKSTGSKIFYPVDSDRIVMRAIVSKEEAEGIVSEMKHIDPIWIENDRQREAKYKEAIDSCDCKNLICIIKTLYARTKEREAQGKRMTYVDERYFKEAREILFQELSIALGINKDDMEEYILSHVE